jgi:hypothetical protein
MIRQAGSTPIGRRLGRVRTFVAIALTVLALGSCARQSDSAAEPAAAVAPQTSAWGDTRVPYRAGSGNFCALAAEGTSIRPDVVNRLVFLPPADAQRLTAELRARDRELVTAAPVELEGDLEAIAQAAARLFDNLEAGGFDLQRVPEEVLGSLSARDLRPAFERASAYLRTQCNIDVHAILSTV